MQLEDALALLQDHHWKRTPQRQKVLELLATAEQPLSAHDIVREIRSFYPDISAETIYRTLHQLASYNIIVPIHLHRPGGERYEWSQTHHHHQICLHCGQITCLPACPVEATPAENGFFVTQHVLEEYGYCAACQTQRSSSNQERKGEEARFS